jgi:amidase
MGVQLFARKGQDRRLLEVAQAYHEATNWPTATPSHMRGG